MINEQCSADTSAGQGKLAGHVAALFWVVFAAVLILKTAAAPAVHTVFPKFAAGAEHWWSSQPLYEADESAGAFRYSPTFAVLMTPFAWLGPRAGGIAWSLSNIALYVGAVRCLTRAALPGPGPLIREAIVLMLAWPIAIRGFWNAQSNPMVSAMLVLAVVAVIRRRWWAAAACLSVATYLKLAPVVIALLFVAAYPRELGWRFVVALVLGGLMPFATRPPDYVLAQYRDWYRYLFDTSADRWPSFRDARMFWEWAGVGTHLRAYACVQAGVGLAIWAWSRWQKQGEPSGSARAALRIWAIGVIYLMLFGPAIEVATYPLAAPVAAWILCRSLEDRAGRALALSGYVLMAVFSLGSTVEFVPLLRAGLPFSSVLLGAWLVLYSGHAAVEARAERTAEQERLTKPVLHG